MADDTVPRKPRRAEFGSRPGQSKTRIGPLASNLPAPVSCSLSGSGTHRSSTRYVPPCTPHSRDTPRRTMRSGATSARQTPRAQATCLSC